MQEPALHAASTNNSDPTKRIDMKPSLFILTVVFLAACSAPSGDIGTLDANNQQLLENGLAKLDSLDQVTWALYETKFKTRQDSVLAMRSELDALGKHDGKRNQLEKAFKDANRSLIEDQIAFLDARKSSMKEVYTRSAAFIAKLDEELKIIDTTRRTPVVTGMRVESREFKDYFRVQGNLEAAQNALVFPELSGIIKSVSIKEGQRVGKGQTIMTLDTDVINKQIKEVETSLALAEDLYSRQKTLWDQNIGSEVQYLEAKNRVESLQNSLATLKEQRSMGTVRAPFAGKVDEIMPKVGEMASPGMPVARVVNLGQLYIEADVSEKHFGKIAVDGEVLVNVRGMENAQAIPAHISRVGSYIKPDNRTFTIRVDFDESRTDLIPNLVTDLMINEFSSEGESTVLPASMVLENAAGNNYVWVLNESNRPERMRIERRIIETGPTYENTTLITSGLKAGEIIVEKGVRKVKNDDLVILSEVQDAPAKEQLGELQPSK